MQPDAIEELELFRAIANSNARALLIGRRALVVLGLPVLTADYDFWIHIDDIAAFNAALEALGLAASHSAEEARQRGRYVLENGEHVDVLVAREVGTVTGDKLAFEKVWERREIAIMSGEVHIALPCIDDLIATKRFVARPRDLEDIRLLEVLREAKIGK